MDNQKALEIARDRIGSISKFIPANESEKKTAEETLEFLKFVEKLLEDQLMRCEDAIKNSMCLGCSLAEQNINADNCKYREQSGLDLCKRILKGEKK